MNILRQLLRQNCFYVAILTVLILFFLLNIVISEALIKTINYNELIKKSLLRFKKVQIDDNVFDVYINQEEKSIIVHGEVEEWEEKLKVEKYFNLKTPSNFNVTYDISVIY